jgi:hypothetical protein
MFTCLFPFEQNLKTMQGFSPQQRVDRLHKVLVHLLLQRGHLHLSSSVVYFRMYYDCCAAFILEHENDLGLPKFVCTAILIWAEPRGQDAEDLPSTLPSACYCHQSAT